MRHPQSRPMANWKLLFVAVIWKLVFVALIVEFWILVYVVSGVKGWF